MHSDLTHMFYLCALIDSCPRSTSVDQSGSLKGLGSPGSSDASMSGTWPYLLLCEWSWARQTLGLTFSFSLWNFDESHPVVETRGFVYFYTRFFISILSITINNIFVKVLWMTRKQKQQQQYQQHSNKFLRFLKRLSKTLQRLCQIQFCDVQRLLAVPQMNI